MGVQVESKKKLNQKTDFCNIYIYTFVFHYSIVSEAEQLYTSCPPLLVNKRLYCFPQPSHRDLFDTLSVQSRILFPPSSGVNRFL